MVLVRESVYYTKLATGALIWTEAYDLSGAAWLEGKVCRAADNCFKVRLAFWCCRGVNVCGNGC